MIYVNVLLIGDSIRMFYENEVRARLGDKYNVYAPEENCRFSSYLLNSLRFYLAEFPTPDIIHFNAGLWDAAILYPEDGCFIGVDAYAENMKKILRVLKNTGAKIIFATTTPVSDAKKNLVGPMPPAHRNEDIISRNKSVLETFKGEDIYINDLFSLIYDNREEYLRDDMIHPNEKGIKILGSAVAEAILQIPFSESVHTGKIYKTNFCEKTIQ